MTLRDAWDEQADDWAAFVRTPGYDRGHAFNFPAFLELLPPPPARTLDVGCGEGRVGAVLKTRGYDVIGVDASERMVEFARQHHEAVVADAAELPFADRSFALVIAYMSLMNFDDLRRTVAEIARVLDRGGSLCAAVLHPLAAAGSWADPSEAESTFVVDEYFSGPTKTWQSDRGDVRVTFYDRPIPLSRYADALESAGLLIQTLREPVPSDEFVQQWPRWARARRVPIYLHFRAVKA